MRYITSIILLFGLVFFQGIPAIAGSGINVETLYSEGAYRYNTDILSKVLQELEDKEETYDNLLLKGKCLYRLQVIHFIKGNKKQSKKYGKRAMKVLARALKKENSIEALGYRALVCQQLIPVNLKSVIYYGSKYGRLAKRMKKMNPEHYLTRLVDAINCFRAPAFVGGDKKKALEEFISLSVDYPEQEDVWVNLADAYHADKQYEKSMEVVDVVLAKNPANLYAFELRKLVEEKIEAKYDAGK